MFLPESEIHAAPAQSKAPLRRHAPATGTVPETIVIIGNGPVGVHFAHQLLRQGWPGQIRIFGEEDAQPYNRVQLSALLNRDISLKQIENPLPEHSSLTQFLCCRVTRIAPEQHLVTDAFGNKHSYTALVLATGSRPHIPSLPGRDLPGIYRFRDLRDVEALYARLGKTRNTVILGGGLLGLETAKAMSRFSTQVTVIQHSSTLMNRQLDEAASLRIQHYAETLGIRFLLNQKVDSINGNQRIESVTLAGGSTLPCDTLIFATGISPNTELALMAKLKIRTGIQIDSRLQTSHPDIYAIGECADYQGQVFGLVAPGLEQASILAANLTGARKEYRGSTLATELKVMGLDVFSMGEVGEIYDLQKRESEIYKHGSTYRRLFFSNNRLSGAIAIGHWPEYKAIQNLIKNRKRVWFWQRDRFLENGNLFASSENSGPLDNLPASTLICNCQQVTLGQIRQCLLTTEPALPVLQQKLGVATVCGTCKPLVQEILQITVETQPVKHKLLAYTLLASLTSCFLMGFNPLPFSQSTTDPGWEWLWTNSLARQISGFTILGLTTLSLVLTLRKRVLNMQWPSFDFWRGTHVVLTLFALLTLVAHTGASFGAGINRWLIINFLLIALVGIGSAFVSAMEGRWVSARIKRIKRSLVLAHIVVFWPLPVLLGFHITSVYYF